ncbi:hypothetical protein HBI73_021320 [Parastagonospora nodorum]|nr:hypothetical protein HBH82_025640 [Parastagonospora nodorum]KAH4673354.1 hypothetical protein HBH78_170720 [Parastagonospora nodorum]KAH4863951.1 hypothetical protein HBH75_003200 [Parastagonospora nodorum]KAH4980860.1 hypothetical protein HBI76_178320 [Parastagonospora nodorum]KAH5038006.1 hypothetical protein HBI74_036780 [Parastagonospora nodorum]
MAGTPTILPSARVFTGPGDRLFGYDRIWVLIHAGTTKTAADYDPGHFLIRGRRGDDGSDLELLTHTLQQAHKEAAYAALHETIHDPTSLPPTYQPHHKPGQAQIALMGDMPLVWTVDFDQNRIFYDREGQHLMYEFSIPEKLPIRLRDFRPYIPMQLPVASTNYMSRISSMTAAPRDDVPEVLFDLVYRFASDYESNWRTSGLTIERYGVHSLAMGILSCFTMKFDMQKLSAPPDKQFPYLARSDFSDLLRWRVWPSPQVVSTVSFGETQIIFTERMDLAMSLVHEHFNTIVTGQIFGESKESHRRHRRVRCNSKIHYIVTSIREIQYFTKTLSIGEVSMTCTPAITLFDGVNPPSETGVRWLLSAIYKQVYPPIHRVPQLPVELQEMILDYALPPRAYDSFFRAVFAARLGLGVSFNFQSQGRLIVLRPLGGAERMRRTESEYQLMFCGRYVGLTYQVDEGAMVQSCRPPWTGADTLWHRAYQQFYQR